MKWSEKERRRRKAERAKALRRKKKIEKMASHPGAIFNSGDQIALLMPYRGRIFVQENDRNVRYLASNDYEDYIASFLNAQWDFIGYI